MLAMTLVCIEKGQIECAGITAASAAVFTLLIIVHMFLDVVRHWNDEDYPINSRLMWVVAATLQGTSLGMAAHTLLSAVWN